MSIIPQALLSSLESVEGFDCDAFVKIHSEEHKITSVRKNPFKPNSLFEGDKKVSWASTGYYLNERPYFTADPLFHAGAYYVQEASSMFLEQIFKQHVDTENSLKVLDLCASPGGKTTHINSLISADSVLVANEIIKSRIPTLCDNLNKWGTANTIVTNNDAKHFGFLNDYFDVVNVDAPCSGSGLFRKQPEAVNEWSENNVNICSDRQQQILQDIIPCIKNNGMLIYSTCSYSISENEKVLDFICENFEVESLAVNLSLAEGVVETKSPVCKAFGYRFYPNRVEGEGFFIACFKVKSNSSFHSKKKEALKPLNNKEFEALSSVLKQDESKIYFKSNEYYYGISKTGFAVLNDISSKLYIKKSGVCIGITKGKDVIPEHQLALALGFDFEVESVELDLHQAQQFLSKLDFTFDKELKGLKKITYNGYGIGWAKFLGNRVNNYLPNELRILKLQHGA